MDEITIRSFAKINLSIDVGPVDEDGYHPVDMIMQGLEFCDDVKVRLKDEESGIMLSTNRRYLPTDERNLAYKAALIMKDRYDIRQGLEIDILKRIPVAAGLAGGSGNGAAVVHALNAICSLDLNLSDIFGICEELGSDVPFSAACQARGNKSLPGKVRKASMATSCVRAKGRGTVMERVPGISAPIVISKPDHSVSTPEVYKGIDHCHIQARPDNDRLVQSLRDKKDPYGDFVNVLEEYTLHEYPKVAELKNAVRETDPACDLMSGSGPTVFGIYKSKKAALSARDILRSQGYEAYWTYTLR